MENYKVIKDYLEALPKNWTVDELLSNINKAELTLQVNQGAERKAMEEYIGKTYIWKETDDDCPITVYLYKIEGVKLFEYNNTSRLLFICSMLQWCDDSIYKLDETTMTFNDVNASKEISENVFNEAVSKYNDFTKFAFDL